MRFWHEMGLTNTKVWYIMPKPCIQRFDNMIHMWYKGQWGYNGLEVWP